MAATSKRCSHVRRATPNLGLVLFVLGSGAMASGEQPMQIRGAGAVFGGRIPRASGRDPAFVGQGIVTSGMLSRYGAAICGRHSAVHQGILGPVLRTNMDGKPDETAVFGGIGSLQMVQAKPSHGKSFPKTGRSAAGGNPASGSKMRTGSPKGLKWAKSRWSLVFEESAASSVDDESAVVDVPAAEEVASLNKPESQQGPSHAANMKAGTNTGSSSKKAAVKEQAADMAKRRLREKLMLRESGSIAESDVLEQRQRSSSPSSHPRRSGSPSSSWDAAAIRIPRNLTSYGTLPELLDLLEPYASGEPGHVVTASDAVGAMNRIKRLSGREGLHARGEAQMRAFADMVVSGMDQMNGKNVGLAVNAACGRGRDYSSLMKAASRRAEQLSTMGWNASSLDVAAISMITNGFAKCLQRDDRLLKALAGFMLRSAFEPEFMVQFNAQAVSVMVNAYAKLGVREPALFSLMSKIAQQILPHDYTPQAVANMLNAFARHDMMDKNLFLYLGEVAVLIDAGEYKSQHMAIILNAFAKMGLQNDKLFAFFADETMARGEAAFDLQAVANILNAYARIYGAEADPRLFKHCGRIVMAKPERDHDAQNLASILNSFVKVEQPDERLFRRISRGVQEVDPLLFDAQAVSNIVHSFAKAEIRDDALFHSMSRICRGMEYMFEGQSVALILNAFSRLEIRDLKLMAHLSKVAKRIPADGYDCQHVENILNAFARLDVKDPELFEHLAGVTMQFKPSDFDPQAIAIVLNSFAKVMPSDNITLRVFTFFSNDVFPSIPLCSFDPTAISIILNAYAKAEIRDERTFNLLARAIRLVGAEQFDAHNIANMFHAFASVDIRDHSTLGTLTNRLTELNVTDMRPEEVAVIAWSAAVARVNDARLTDFLIQGIDTHLGNMDPNFLRQAHQFLLTCELDGLLDLHCVENGHDLDLIRIRSRATPLQVVDYLGQDLKVCREAFCSLAPEGARTSRLQWEVARAFESMGMPVVEEYVDPRSGYSLDLVVYPSEEDRTMGLHGVAVEVDGPSHYAVGTRTRLGRTVMKHRHLAQLGFDFRVLPYWEWDDLSKKADKEVYLRKLIFAEPSSSVAVSPHRYSS